MAPRKSAPVNGLSLPGRLSSNWPRYTNCRGEAASPLQLVYRGQLDDSRPGNDKPLTGADLRGAIDAVLADKPVSLSQKASIGCNIKWKKGNEPAYFGGRG